MFTKNSVEDALQPLPSAQDRTYDDVQAITSQVVASSSWIPELRDELKKVVIGQDHLINSLFVSLLTGGHILLEGLPGLAKTLAVKALAQAINTDFRRIQFTPDMLPADIIGTELYNPRNTSFEVKKGPIFSSLVLAPSTEGNFAFSRDLLNLQRVRVLGVLSPGRCVGCADCEFQSAVARNPVPVAICGGRPPL